MDFPDNLQVIGKAYPETDSVNKNRGWFEISWDPVPNATSYRVLVYNGVHYEEFENVKTTKWSTKGRNLWPTDKEIAAGKYNLHISDTNGAEFPIDPGPAYQNAAVDGGGSSASHRYSIRVRAVSSTNVESSNSDVNYGYIPLETPKNVSVSGQMDDYVNSIGTLNIKWNAVIGAGGYVVEIFDGKNYKSFDVGKVTSWNSTGKSLFKGIVNLPADPTKQYISNGADQTFIAKKAYQVRVRAYRYNDSTAPASEEGKISGYRGLSEASTIQYGTIPLQEDLLGLEDYFTYGTHQMGNGNMYVNVTAGNMIMKLPDENMVTRGSLGFTFTRYYNSRSTRTTVLGNGWTFMGNESLQIVAAVGSTPEQVLYYDEDGTLHTFSKDSSTNSYTSPKGKYLTLTKETVNGSDGYRIKDKEQFSKVFEKNPLDSNSYRLFSYQDEFNNTIRFIYNSANQLTEIKEVDSSGNKIKNSILLTYYKNTVDPNDPKNGLLDTLAYNTHKVQYGYNSNKQLIKTTLTATGSSDNITNNFYYNGDGLLDTYKDAKGKSNTISFDENQIIINQPEFDNGPNSPNSTTSESNEYDFDYAKNLYTVSNAEGNTTTYKRDTTNKTFAVVDTTNNQHNTKVTYDTNYNVLKSTQTDGTNPVITTTNQYDSNGNLIQSTEKSGSEPNKTTVSHYDSKNRVIDVTDPEGKKTTYEYGLDHSETISIGKEVTKYEYDPNGRQIKISYPNGTFETTTYTDSANKVVQIDKEGNSVTTIYDSFGHAVSITDKGNRTIQYTYDPLYTERLLSVTDGLGKKTSYVYDKNGNLTTLTDAKNRKKTFNYNDNNQLIQATTPMPTSTGTLNTTYLYDHAGNILKTTKSSGTVITNQYNEDEQVNNIDIVGKSKNKLHVTFNYKDSGDLNNIEFKDTVLNKVLSKKDFDYYDSGLIKTLKNGNFQLSYDSYDLNDRITNDTFQYSEGNQTWSIKQGLTYTDEGKTDSLSTETNGTKLLSYGYFYDLTNNKINVTVNNGLFTKETSLKDSNVTKAIVYKKGTTTTTYSYEYDGSGNILKETSPLGESTYTYDANNQLKTEVIPNRVTNSYTYDEVGNRLTDTQNDISHSFTYNNGNQISAKDGVSYKYDDDGNLLQDEKYKYEYNAAGQQTRITNLQSVEVARYEYDEEGLRTKKIIGNEIHEYYYESGNLSLEIVRDSSGIKQYRYYQWDSAGIPLGMIIREKDTNGNWQNTVFHFWTNKRGDILTILDNSGNEVGSYMYDAFGNVLSENGTVAQTNPIRYAGYYYDAETKHYYLQARYYNPENGNFQELDPQPGDLYNPNSQNGYNYVENNPVTFVDPSGNIKSERQELGLDGGTPGMISEGNFIKRLWNSFRKSLGRLYKGTGKISGKDIVFSDKFKKPAYKNQVSERGWTKESIAKVINKPYKTASAVNKYTKNSVTVYFKDKTHYIAVDNGTGKVIQVSDLNKSNWKFDPNFSK